MEVKWEDGFTIAVKAEKDTVVISANKEGLKSLAAQFIELAEGMPGDHLHYDAYNSLEEDSAEMIVVRVP